MTSFHRIATAATLLLLSACSGNTDAPTLKPVKIDVGFEPIEDIDYTTITPIANDPFIAVTEVLEFFSYGCPHCYQAQPSVQALQMVFTDRYGKDDAPIIVTMPVIFSDSTAFFARAYYTFEALEALDTLHERFFHALHAEKRKLFDEDALLDWISDQGFDRQTAEAAFHAPSTEIKLQRAAQLGNAYNINATPTYVVDGHYMTGPGMTQSHEKTAAAIAALVDMIVSNQQ